MILLVQSLSSWRDYLEFNYLYLSFITSVVNLMVTGGVFRYIFSTYLVLNDRVKSLRSRSGDKFKTACHKKNVNILWKIIVWGAIPIIEKNMLHFFKGAVNVVKYIEVLKKSDSCLKYGNGFVKTPGYPIKTQSRVIRLEWWGPGLLKIELNCSNVMEIHQTWTLSKVYETYWKMKYTGNRTFCPGLVSFR